MGLFQALESGKRALLSHQLYMTTIGQNIANVDTPGYSRQRVELSASDPLRTTLGMVGTGVQVTDVRHVRDLFLGTQLRQETKSLGRWQYKEKILSQIESMFNEPGDSSLRTQIDEFFNSWSQLANAPESTTNRNEVVSRAVTMSNTFQQLRQQLTALKDSVDGDLAVRVRDVNLIASEITDLNQKIARQELDGQSANDLRDRRDLLIDRLSGYVDVNVVEDRTGSVRVYVGAMTIVDGVHQYELSTKTEIVNGAQKSSLVYNGSKVELKNLNGELHGLVETRDEVIPSFVQQLDELAKAIADEVNGIHQSGYGLRPIGGTQPTTGNLFFSLASVSAGTISVNQSVIDDVSLIAASQSGEPGDASNALAMAQLREAKVLGGTLTFQDYFGRVVADVGVKSKQAKQVMGNQELIVQQITNAKEQVQGVSLDEEMAQLIRAQHAYDAAARVITTVDQAFDTVINGMGIVGR